MTGDNPEQIRGPGRAASTIMRRFVSAQLLWGYRVAGELGLTTSELGALNIIALEDTVTPGRLSRLTGLSPAAVTRLVDRLVERGFVVRAADDGDRRKVRISATGTWQGRIDAAVEPHRAAMRTIMSDMTPEERQAVFRYLEQAGPAMIALLEPPTDRPPGD